jgi:hypothetical protein
MSRVDRRVARRDADPARFAARDLAVDPIGVHSHELLAALLLADTLGDMVLAPG